MHTHFRKGHLSSSWLSASQLHFWPSHCWTTHWCGVLAKHTDDTAEHGPPDGSAALKSNRRKDIQTDIILDEYWHKD